MTVPSCRVRANMSALEETLVRISKDFAHQIVNALAALPFEAWHEELPFAAPPVKSARGRRASPSAKAAVAESAPAEPPSEMETSILEHLNEAGPTGSTVRAWVISTQGELPQDEHDALESSANAVLDALEAKGLILRRARSISRGQVYALAPVPG